MGLRMDMGLGLRLGQVCSHSGRGSVTGKLECIWG